MYHIQQGELFSFEEFMEWSWNDKYSVVLQELPISSILQAIHKKSAYGRPEHLNTRAMLYSLIIGKMEHIRFTKDLVNQLKTNPGFRKLCRFTDSDRIPSEAAYSRLVTKLAQTGVLHHISEEVVDQAFSAGFLQAETIAVDSSHLEAFDRNPKLDKGHSPEPEAAAQQEPELIPEAACAPQPQSKPPKPTRSKRGRIPKAEREEWDKQMEAYQASRTLFERDIVDMLPASYEELLADMPQYPSTGAKGDPRGTKRVKYWYGYKMNMLVDTASQYIVTYEMCSGHVNDQRMALLLFKRLKERFPQIQVKHVVADKGYDGESIYKQIRELGAFPIIPLIHRSKLPEGVDSHFRPVCQAGHSYPYDSYDPKWKTLKWTAPKECAACPLNDGHCQKVYKVRVDQDVRKYTAPGRGSEKFNDLMKQRTAIERVFAYLKLYVEMSSTRRLKKRAFVDYDLSCLTYNLCKLALDKLNQARQTGKAA